MKTNTIITIGREFGSAGREIGYKVAKKFGIKLYDKEMLAQCQQKKAESVKKYLNHMTKNLQAVFSIH